MIYTTHKHTNTHTRTHAHTLPNNETLPGYTKACRHNHKKAQVTTWHHDTHTHTNTHTPHTNTHAHKHAHKRETPKYNTNTQTTQNHNKHRGISHFALHIRLQPATTAYRQELDLSKCIHKQSQYIQDKGLCMGDSDSRMHLQQLFCIFCCTPLALQL
eukprot:GHVQ01020033.1.p2 GENE.GHVQ01020033.1~~GHVQ01020033.1.p2  ORF type:complete len:158 (+),score=24.68 GHVQ01020033.1:640-1113(+)